MAIEVGQRLLHYRLTAKIGEGGMGEVWSAVDTTLDREVAIKVLPERWADETERVQRFEREAKVVAGLNHPNIVTLHSVEQAEGVHFITMELVRGNSLSQAIPRKGMDLADLLETALPLTSAVAAAHEQGITHRDLKPANVMIGKDGQVKVLDFGLAKRGDIDDELSTQMATRTVTSEGRILGTAAYMSPEQAEGRPLDRRSDVFSLGIVLYEMATGRRPFEGDTQASVVSSILRDEPTSILEMNPALPRHFARVLRRCLAKQPDRRYSSALDLHNELRELKEELDSGELTVPAAVPARRSRAMLWIAPVGLLAIAAAVWFGMHLREEAGGSVALPDMRVESLTSGGVSVDAAISPDGRYVARIERLGDTDRSRILLRQLSTGSEVEIVPLREALLDWLAFSPDGSYVYYTDYTENGRLMRVPTLGGTPRRIADRLIDMPPSCSPDGKQVVVVRRREGGDGQEVVLIAVEGTEERVIASKESGSYGSPAWSPDGETIVFNFRAPNRVPQTIAIRLGDSSERVIAEIPGLSRMVWMPDGTALVGNIGGESGLRTSQLWLIPFPAGDPIRVTRDTSVYQHATVSADGRSLVATRLDWWFSIWIVSRSNPQDLRQVLAEREVSYYSWPTLDWLDGNRIIFDSHGERGHALSVVDVTTGEVNALDVPGRTLYRPLAVKGQDKVLVHEDVDGRAVLHLLDFPSGELSRVAEGVSVTDSWPAPDGEGVYYLQVPGDGEGAGFIEYRDLKGGEPRRVLDRRVLCFGIADDEQTFAVCSESESGDGRFEIISLVDGSSRDVTDLFEGARWMSFVRGSTSLSYSLDGTPGVWLEEEGAVPRRIAPFGKYFAWSPDGERLAVIRQGVRDNVVLIRDFDPRVPRSP